MNIQYQYDPNCDWYILCETYEVDGGRAYIKSSGCKVYVYRVKDGEMVENG